MRIAVLGTGVAGRALATAFDELGHEVLLGTRDPEVTSAREGWEWSLPLARYAEAARDADVVINATSGTATLAALDAAGAALEGKVLIDVANPLDFSQGFPPSLFVKDTDSLAEQIQRAHPATKVVKALNTTANEVMVAPHRVGDGDTSIFVAGDDPGAREAAASLLRELGWRDVVEFDSLQAARGLEMWLPLWISLMQKFGRASFNIKVVR